MATITKKTSEDILKRGSLKPIDAALVDFKTFNELVDSNNDIEERVADLEDGNIATNAVTPASGTFTVNGNEEITGNLDVDGNFNVDGLFYLTGTPQTLTGAGAVNLTTKVTLLVTTGANALTLAAGADGQVKIIKHKTDGGDGTLTVTGASGFSTITFSAVGQTATLLYKDSTWNIISVFGAVAA